MTEIKTDLNHIRTALKTMNNEITGALSVLDDSSKYYQFLFGLRDTLIDIDDKLIEILELDE